MDLARVSILAVGGTVAMTGDRGRAVEPALSADDLVAAVPGIGEAARVTARTVAGVPSPHMDLALVDRVARKVVAELDAGAGGVVITQGTDTIEESAFALELMLGAGGAPVVVTGAMRPPDGPGGDGPANLRDALALAAAPGARGLGVCVVMDGAVHAPRFVAKADTSAAGAFAGGPVLPGRVTEGRFARHGAVPPLPATGWRPGTAPAPVALLTAALGDDGALVDHVAAAGYAGLVIAGMGGGHVHPDMAGRIADLGGRFPVVVASRTGGGATLAATYGYAGGEIDLARAGVIRAGWLSPLKARVALSLLLGAGATRPAIRDFFGALDGG